MNFLYEKELGINIKDFFNDCYRSLGIPIVSVGIISFLVCQFINIRNSFIQIIVKIIFVIIIYFGAIFKVLNLEEKEMLRKIIKKINIL